MHTYRFYTTETNYPLLIPIAFPRLSALFSLNWLFPTLCTGMQEGRAIRKKCVEKKNVGMKKNGKEFPQRNEHATKRRGKE